MFCQPIFEPALGRSIIKAVTFTSKPIHHISGIAIGNTYNVVDFFTEDIFEPVSLCDVHAVDAPTTTEVADWTV